MEQMGFEPFVCYIIIEKGSFIMTQGIYLFTNTINNKHYVGQSVNIENRYKAHIYASKNTNSTDYDTPLHRAFRKYGTDNFSFEILEEVPDHKDLNNKENYYIKKYNCLAHRGYNQIITSRDGLSPDELKERLYLKYGVTTDILYKQLVEMPFTKVASIYGVSDNAVRKWCKLFGLSRKSSDYMTDKKRKEISTKAQPNLEKGHIKKPVKQMDKHTGETIKIWDSTEEAAKTLGTSRWNIARSFPQYDNGRNTSCGYKWDFVN